MKLFDDNFEMLTKTVRVTDPWRWYGRETVNVSLRVTAPWQGKVTIRIAVNSIDDFAVYYMYECDEKYKALIKSMYEHLKEYMYDRMPDEISVEWLYEHGYLPD